MTLTTDIKDELSNITTNKSSSKKAEISAILRFSSNLHTISNRLVIESEIDHQITAYKLKEDINNIYGHNSDIIAVSTGSFNKSGRFILRFIYESESLARQTGLLDNRGIPVRGLSPTIIQGSTEDAEAIWRGAFLAHGSLIDRGRSSILEIVCPGSEAALALAGVARRLGISVKAKEIRGGDRVIIRDDEAISFALMRIGAKKSALKWEERRARRAVRANANRLVNFDDANLRRSAQAAVAAGARVERALEILGSLAPNHLKYAGELRIRHKQSSLDELGRLAEPPMTKDAIAGRIRRLLAMADKKARELEIPTTESNIPNDDVNY